MRFSGDQEKPFLFNHIRKNFSIKNLINRLCLICAVGLLLSSCATSSSTTSTDGNTVVDNLRLVYDEDQAEARQQAVTVSNNGKLIAFAYDNGIIKIVDLTTGRTVKKMSIPYSDLFDIRFNKDASKLIIVENDSEAVFVDIQEEQLVKRISLPEEVTKVAISPSEEYVAFGMAKGTLSIYDLSTYEKVFEEDTGKRVLGLTFNPQKDHIAVFSYKKIGMSKKEPPRIYDINTGNLIQEFDNEIVISGLYSENGEKLIFSGAGTISTLVKNYDFSTQSFENIYKKTNWTSATLYISVYVHNEMLLAASVDNTFDVIDLKSGEKMYTTQRESFSITSLGWASPERIYPLYDDKSFLINYTDNNINEIYNAETNKITAYIYSDANDDFAVVSRDGRMEGNQAAISSVAWSERKSNKRVPLEATFDRYYTPNLLQSLLSDDFEYAETEEDNLEKAIELAPDVQITRPDSIFTANQSKVQIEASATSNGDPVEEIQILVNGKPIGEGQRGLKVAGSHRTEEVEIIPGQSTISAVAVTEEGYRSKPDLVHINYEGPTAESNLYLLAVGIDEYKNGSYNLNYATTDAKALVQEIQDKAGSIFDDIEVSYIADSKATKSNITQAISSIRKEARPQDMFVFYYAGHGVMSEGNSSAPGDFYLALHDVTQLYGSDQMLSDRGISAAELRKTFGDIEARKQMIMLDACQSGGAVETFAQRGAAEEKAMIQLARSTGITLLASTGTEQFATEFEELGHGVFTYTILEGLSGNADGGSEDGKITVKELEAYLNDMVPELTEEYKGTVQYPRSWSQGMDFPVGVVN